MDEQFSPTPFDEADETQPNLTEPEETEVDTQPETEPEDDPLAGAFQYDDVPATPKKSRLPIILLAVLLVLVLVGGLLWAFGVFDKKDVPAPDGTPSAFGTEDVSDLTAAKSANFEMSNGMFSFNMESSYLAFQGQYGSSLSSLGVDTTASLKGQAAYGNNGTWFDFFLTRAKSDAEWMLVMSEAAKADGCTIDESAREQITAYLDEVDFSAFHNGVTREDGEALLTMYYTALTQENALFDAMTFTDEEMQAYYDAHRSDFDVCSYAYFVFSIGENGDFATADAAADAVNKLTACKTADAFRRAVAEYLVSTGMYETVDAAGKAYDSACVKQNAAYTESDGISDWLFAADTAVGSTKTMQNDTAIGVYMLTAAPGRNTDKTVNVRHILLSADTCGSDEAAAAKADELLNEWKAGEATAASFGELARQYTEDSNAAAGGLYEGVTQGMMVTEFDDWCFDNSRQVGDTGVVKTQFGYHVMYFEGAQETWVGDVRSQMGNERYSEQYQAYQALYPVTFYDDNINRNDM